MTDRTRTDRTTKCLLAAVALGLWACALRPWLGPTPAGAQNPAPAPAQTPAPRRYSVTESSVQNAAAPAVPEAPPEAPPDDPGPVLCRDADNPARQPVEVTRRLTGSASQYYVRNTLYTVPPGKRLVVEYLSATAHEAGDANSYNFQVTVTQGGQDQYANFNALADRAPYSAASQPVRLYADPGTTVTLDAYTSGQNATSLDFTLSGFLVDVP